MVGEDDDALNVEGDRLLDVARLHVVRVVRADDLQVAVILGGGARDTHEDVEQVGVVEHVADEGNRAPLRGGALGGMSDHRSPPLLALDVVLARQFVEGFDDGDAADAIVLGQLSLGWQKAPGRKLTSLYALEQRRVDLVIERQWIARVDRPIPRLSHRSGDQVDTSLQGRATETVSIARTRGEMSLLGRLPRVELALDLRDDLVDTGIV